jgi:hypothetical protein
MILSDKSWSIVLSAFAFDLDFLLRRRRRWRLGFLGRWFFFFDFRSSITD